MHKEASVDEYLDNGSGSEEEELADNEDDSWYEDHINNNDKSAQGDASQFTPSMRSLSDRGLPKSVNYVWLNGKFVNTAVDPAKTKGKAHEKGKGKAMSIEEQELEFVRHIDETTHGHAGNTQAAYKSTYRLYLDFCNRAYADQGLKRYEVTVAKTARFLSEKLFPISTMKNIPMHIVKDTKVFMHRSVIQAYGIPIEGEGLRGTFDFALYLKALAEEI
ncbi:hypothetical protein BGZ95_007171 [Linnemannia exigua]|uniref:Uncharacterized protein n=1 Tax=Linnemannia exigua TaxID=604196 RepID=A0AAD4D229_9FUNG|nr:hypothetical protein BGZ95_007171 [Linnemannia exigua]